MPASDTEDESGDGNGDGTNDTMRGSVECLGADEAGRATYRKTTCSTKSRRVVDNQNGGMKVYIEVRIQEAGVADNRERPSR